LFSILCVLYFCIVFLFFLLLYIAASFIFFLQVLQQETILHQLKPLFFLIHMLLKKTYRFCFGVNNTPTT
jgi:hypothetical protein